MWSRRTPGIVAVLVLFAVTACNKSTPQGPSPAEKGGPVTYRVAIDGVNPSRNEVFTAYFPGEVSAHPGDTVTFSLAHFNGEPHSVTLGTLVDAAVAKLTQLGPTATFAQQEALPEVAKLPDMVPHTNPKAGPPDVNQSATAPCYLDSGDPPNSLEGSAPACPKATQPEFTGTQSFYSSGALGEDGAKFSMKLSKDIKPAAYSIICLLHRGPMTGKLEVVAASEDVPSPAEVEAKGKQELNKLVAALKPAEEQADGATADKPVAGTLPPNIFNAVVAEFAPKEVSVKPGDSVTWDVFYFHTVALAAPEDAVGFMTKGADGVWHLNLKAGPTNSPPLPKAYADIPPTATQPTTVAGGDFDGSTYKNSGLLPSLPPAVISYKVAFKKAGTYEVRCSIHPDMKAKVKVG